MGGVLSALFRGAMRFTARKYAGGVRRRSLQRVRASPLIHTTGPIHRAGLDNALFGRRVCESARTAKVATMRPSRHRSRWLDPRLFKTARRRQSPGFEESPKADLACAPFRRHSRALAVSLGLEEGLNSVGNGGKITKAHRDTDVFICKLRKKLATASGGKDYIETVWGRGYVMREQAETAARICA